MNNLQYSDWSTNKPSNIHERTLDSSVNAWKAANPSQKPQNTTSGLWLSLLLGFGIGALVCGVALATLLTIWLGPHSTTVNSTIITTTVTTSTTTTTQFLVGWNATGITIAGLTSTAGVANNEFNHPYCVILDSSNTAYVSDQSNNRVQKWLTSASSATTAVGQSNGVAGSGLSNLYSPTDLVIDSSGNLYVSDGGNNRVVRWLNGSSSGTVVAGTGIAGNALNQLNGSLGIALDSSSGTLYISDSGNHRVMQYLTGASSGTLVAGGNGAGIGTNQLNNPRGLYFDSTTNSLFIANNLAFNIVQWVLGSSTWTLITGSNTGTTGTTSTLLSYPTDVTFDYLGNMYVSDEGNHRIQFYLPGQSNGTTVAGTTGTFGNTAQLLHTPSSVAVDSQFNIYVTDYNNQRVQKFLHY